ncbi:hypothetical protein ACW9HQ_53140, partial [Nocardia gipuzkoensis]
MRRIPHGRRAVIALAAITTVLGVTSACSEAAKAPTPPPVFASGTDTPGMTPGGSAMPAMP